jgi:cyanate permease
VRKRAHDFRQVVGECNRFYAWAVSKYSGLTSFRLFIVVLYFSGRHSENLVIVDTAFGPLTAGWFFDIDGDYSQFLQLVCVMVVIASIMLLSLGRAQPFDDSH